MYGGGRQPRYDPSEYAQRKAMQRDRAERIRAARTSRLGSAGGDSLAESAVGGGGGGSLSSTFPPPSSNEARQQPLAQQQYAPQRKHSGSSAASGDDLLSRLEALKTQLSAQPADRHQVATETMGRTRSEQERVRREEAEAALQHERHKHTTMQDEIAGLRHQITALQGTRGAPPPLASADARPPIGRSSAGEARTPVELKREMDEALERANRLSEERVTRQQEREEAEERERQARQAEDKAWAHVRFLVERDAKAHREAPQPAPSQALRMQPLRGPSKAPVAVPAPAPAPASSRLHSDRGYTRPSRTGSDDDKLARLLRELHSHESMYGKNHAKYADACYNVGLHHRAQGRASEAHGFFQEAGDIYGYLYGEDHDETVEARDCAAECQLAADSASSTKTTSPLSTHRPPPATATTGYRPSVAQYSDEDEDEGDGLEDDRGGDEFDNRGFRQNRASDASDGYAYHEQSHAPQSAGSRSDPAWRSKVSAGNRIDAQDSQSLWYEGIVEDTRSNEVLVHYVGWPHTFDEWLQKDSLRLQPLHTYTNPDGSSVGPDKETGRPSSPAHEPRKSTTRQSHAAEWSQDFTSGSLSSSYADDDDDVDRGVGAGYGTSSTYGGRTLGGRAAQVEAAGPDDVPPSSSSVFSAVRSRGATAPEQSRRRRGSPSLPLPNGSVVEAKWSNGEWYHGVVGSSEKFDDGTVDCYSITFDDGAVLDGVLPDAVRSAAVPAPAPAPAPAPPRGGGSSSRGASTSSRSRRDQHERGMERGGAVRTEERRVGMGVPTAQDEYGSRAGRSGGGSRSARTVSPPTAAAPVVVDIDSIPVGGGGGAGGMPGVSEYPDDTFGAGGSNGRAPVGAGASGASIDELADEYASGPQEPLIPCRVCGRRFKESSLAKHENICGGLKRRSKFDSKAARVAGTDAAKFTTGSSSGSSRSAGRGPATPAGKNPKWKQQSNQLREAMKMARQVAQAQKDGVPLSELPMPAIQDDADDGASLSLQGLLVLRGIVPKLAPLHGPLQHVLSHTPQLTDAFARAWCSDRVPCPHCGRKFNAKAAERHIPRCQDLGTKPLGRAMGAGSSQTWMHTGGRAGSGGGGGGGGGRAARSSGRSSGMGGAGTRRR